MPFSGQLRSSEFETLDRQFRKRGNGACLQPTTVHCQPHPPSAHAGVTDELASPPNILYSPYSRVTLGLLHL